MEQTFLGLENRQAGIEDLQAEKASGSFSSLNRGLKLCFLIGQEVLETGAGGRAEREGQPEE